MAASEYLNGIAVGGNWLLNNTVALYKNNQLLASQQQTQATREAKWQAEKAARAATLEQHATLQACSTAPSIGAVIRHKR